jgi:signal transduction histidine kinase/DNA-binding response OmpR family regulator
VARRLAELRVGADPVYRRIVQGLSAAAILALAFSVLSRATAPAVGLLAAALAAINLGYAANGTWQRAQAHSSVALLAATALLLPLDFPSAATPAALLMLVAAAAARPLTGPMGGRIWLVLCSLGTGWTLLRASPDALTWVTLLRIAFVLSGICLAYAFVAFFVSTREKSLAKLGTAIELATAAEAKAKNARAANEELLARVTHDLRTPLAGIMGVCEVLQMEAAAATTAERLNLIRGSAGMMLHVVQDLLDRATSQRNELEIRRVRFDLRQAVEECVGVVSPLARAKELTLDLSLPLSIPQHLIGDPVRLRQVLMNLLGNAVKFTRRGRVSVAVLEQPVSRGRAGYRFEVADTGPGLAGSLQEILAAGPRRGAGPGDADRGAGLGLQICQQLVKAMHGQLGAQSSPGAGSTLWFEIAFDIDAHPSGPRVPVSPPDRSVGAGSPCNCVLVVEDDVVIARVLSDFLGLLGIAVDHAPTAGEAAELYSPERHDLVLVDLNLPDRLGSDLALDLRQRAAVAERFVILGMSADSRLASWNSPEAHAFDDVLIKPIGLEQLREAIAGYFSAPGVKLSDAGYATTTAVVNLGRIEALRALEQPTQRPLLRLLVDSYARSAPALVEEIARAAASGGRESVRAAAHKLRGSSGNIGADAAMNLAARIEEASDSRSYGELQSDAARLQEVVTEAIQTLHSVV